MLISHIYIKVLWWNHQNGKYLEPDDARKGRFCSIFYLDPGDPEDVCKSIHSGCLQGGTVLQPRYEDVWIQTVSVHMNFECVHIQAVSVDMKVFGHKVQTEVNVSNGEWLFLRYVYSMDSDSKSLHENKTIMLVQGTRIGVGWVFVVQTFHFMRKYCEFVPQFNIERSLFEYCITFWKSVCFMISLARLPTTIIQNIHRFWIVVHFWVSLLGFVSRRFPRLAKRLW